MEENRFCDVYDLFQSDPDILRIAGSEVSFTEVDINENTAFIIYSDSEYRATESEIKDMLQRFYADNIRDYFTNQDSSWKVFRSLVNGIAGIRTTQLFWASVNLFILRMNGKR